MERVLEVGFCFEILFKRYFLDMDFLAYQLLYGITFYNMTDRDIARMDIHEKDTKIIEKVKHKLEENVSLHLYMFRLRPLLT